jgi:hypothetical protein
MIEKLKKQFKEEFGALPRLPTSIVLNDGVFEVSKELKNTVFKIKPLSIGLLLWDKYNFSQAFLEFNKKRINNYLILNEKSSFLITCGRKLLKKGIIKRKGRGNTYAAMNERKEIIGVINFKDKTYKNKINIGSYLEQDKLKRVVF